MPAYKWRGLGFVSLQIIYQVSFFMYNAGCDLSSVTTIIQAELLFAFASVLSETLLEQL